LGTVYHTPIEIHLPITTETSPGYPFIAPVVKVSKTDSMEVTPNHKFVSLDGTVNMAELTGWSRDTSTLYGVITRMQRIFSEEPPLYSTDLTSRRIELLERYRERWTEVVKPIYEKMEEQKNLQRILEERRDKVEHHLESLKLGIESAEHEISEFDEAIDIASRYIASEKALEFTSDSLLEPADPLSAQIMDLTAKDVSFEELLIAYDLAFKADRLSFPDFMDGVRKTSGEMFWTKILLEKCLGMQT